MPRPGPVSSEARPPWAAAMAATMESPSPVPPPAARARRIRPVEALEDARRRPRSPMPGPLSRDLELGALGVDRTRTCTSVPGGGVDASVGKQVRRSPGGGGPRRRSPSTGPLVVERDGPVGRRPPRASSTASLASAARSTGVALERPALVEAGQQEQVVDEHAHPRRSPLRCAASPWPGRRAARRRTLAEELGVAADRGQRRAQLVRGVGDEPAQPLLRGGCALGERRLDAAPSMVVERACRAGRPRCGRRPGSTRCDRSPAAMASAVVVISIERAQADPEHEPRATADGEHRPPPPTVTISSIEHEATKGLITSRAAGPRRTWSRRSTSSASTRYAVVGPPPLGVPSSGRRVGRRPLALLNAGRSGGGCSRVVAEPAERCATTRPSASK